MSEQISGTKRKCFDNERLEHLVNQRKKRANERYGNKLDFSNFDFSKKNREIQTVLCIKHNIIFETCSAFISQGITSCIECKKEQCKTRVLLKSETNAERIKRRKEIVLKVNSNKNHDYSKINFGLKRRIKQKVYCKDHDNLFETTIDNLMTGKNSCNECIKSLNEQNSKIPREITLKRLVKIHGEYLIDFSKIDFKKNIFYKQEVYCRNAKYNNGQGHKKFFIPLNDLLKGSGCSHCKNKSEGKVKVFLMDTFSDDAVEVQHSLKELGSGKLKMDLKLKLENKKDSIIELDGLQHFENVKRFKGRTFEENVTNDMEKMQHCYNRGMSIIRIYQPPMKKVKYTQWQDYVLRAVEAVKKSTKPLVIFENRKEYDRHRLECRIRNIEYIDL